MFQNECCWLCSNNVETQAEFKEMSSTLVS